jgi:hypothetical protein
MSNSVLPAFNASTMRTSGLAERPAIYVRGFVQLMEH